MTKERKKKQRARQQSTLAPASRWKIWLSAGGVVIVAVVLGWLFWPGQSPAPPVEPPASPSAASPSAEPRTAEIPTAEEAVRPNRLEGRWLRPDGGYILEIRGVAGDGTLEAGYFNPSPIHVAQARWRQKDSRLEVFVELRDVNYPGSTYTLEYRKEEDRLVGLYYQAVQKMSFEVEFIRAK